MLIIEKLNEKENMTDGEESIAKFMLGLGEELNKYSTRSIAEATFTSPPTVIRLCKKMGFEGFEDFKEQFIKEISYLDQQFGKVDVNFPFLKEDTMMRVANKITHLYDDTVEDTLNLLHHDSLQKALNLLTHSKTIHIFSSGTAMNLAESFKEKMMKIGKRVNISSNLNYQLYEVECIPQEDIAIVISYSGETETALQVARSCKQRHIPIIALTSFGENSLSSLSDIELYISTKESLYNNIGDFSTHLSIHLLLDVLYSLFFWTQYDENYLKRIGISKKLESLRSSSNPIINEGVED